MKKILIDATGSAGWIGGLYYKKNIIFSLLENDYIKENYLIYIVTDPAISEFDIFCEKAVLKKFNSKYRRLKILFYCLVHHITVLYPYSTSYDDGENFFNFFKITTVNWIPDFQHVHYPCYFNESELNRRNNNYSKIAASNNPLVLSSNNCNNDCRISFGRNINTYIVPFVSYIENELETLSISEEVEIIKKYKLDKPFVCIMNQFWKHKNHIVVLNAIKEFFENNPESDFKFVFTGKLEDFRDPNYIDKLKELFEEPEIKKHTVLLGFIDRKEQIAIMKNAGYIIQPSLFEGWGTVVEDAKVLDKTILLSDIPVHHEQMNDKCILFDPDDSASLAKLIEEENKKEHNDNIEKGISDMYKRAKEYSKGFEQLLKDLERN